MSLYDTEYRLIASKISKWKLWLKPLIAGYFTAHFDFVSIFISKSKWSPSTTWKETVFFSYLIFLFVIQSVLHGQLPNVVFCFSLFFDKWQTITDVKIIFKYCSISINILTHVVSVMNAECSLFPTQHSATSLFVSSILKEAWPNVICLRWLDHWINYSLVIDPF